MKHKTILSTKKRVSRKGWVLAAGSLILSILVIAGLLQVNQKRNEEVFQKLISEILSVSHQQQEFEGEELVPVVDDDYTEEDDFSDLEDIEEIDDEPAEIE